MALVNPAPNFRFQVFLFPADPSLPSSVGEFAKSALSLGIGIASSIIFGGFSEVTGLTAENEVEEYREGGRNFGPHRFTRTGKYPNLVLKRGITFTPDLWDWHYQAMLGTSKPLRKNAIVILNDSGGGVLDNPTGLNLPVLDTTPVAVWFVSNGLPQKLEASQFKATGNEIAVESLEIAHEGLFRVGMAQIPSVGDLAAQIGL
jgi:phage tail-like protein